MVASRESLTWLIWTLVALVVISAAVTLLFALGPLLPSPDPTDDLVDQLFFMRTQDEQAFPFVLVGSLASLGVFLIGAMLGVALRSWAEPSPTRDAMTLLLVFGGMVGLTAQLLNIGVGDAARPYLCDCGYRAEEMIGLDRALSVGWTAVSWMLLGALALVGFGVALAGRLIEVSRTWRTLSYAIAGAILFAAALQITASVIFIDDFDPYLVADLTTAAVSGILVPVWAILLWRGVSVPVAQPAPAMAA
jgi:hypothetical protein